MNKETFRSTEERLKRFYKKEDKIKSLKKSIEILDIQIADLERELKSCNITIEPESSALNFDERVQTSNDGTSYAEREVMRITEIKIRRLTEKKLARERKQDLIENIEVDSIELEDIIAKLSEEHKQILEYKYKNGWGELKISQEVHLSQSQVNKKLRQIILVIDDWNRWGGIILE